MILDGDILEVGDTVFDIVSRSTAEVTAINDETFEVMIKGRNAIIKQNGYIGTVRRIYWHDPVIFVPGKDDLNKRAQLTAIAGVL